MRRCYKQSLLCLLPLKSPDKFLYFGFTNCLVCGPLLCLNINVTEAKLILFNNSVNTAIVRLLRYHSSLINTTAVPHL